MADGAEFTGKSAVIFAELHPKLQEVVAAARKRIGFTLTAGYRGKADQEAAYNAGNSKARWLQSAHNYKPAVAVDVLPLPFKGWNDFAGFRRISQIMLDEATKRDIPLRWGGDWDRDGDEKDERFRDFPHYELHPWRTWAKAA